MPRYCAAKLCKNRGGLPSKDNKKISFYPFPLQDHQRLQQWVINMRREEWTPSRHQYLCSDHFTEDSFDMRWGIRYLKHTAVPTIFPFTYDRHEAQSMQDEWNRRHTKRKPRPKQKTSDIKDTDTSIRPASPLKKKALILKRDHLREHLDSPLPECAQEKDVKAVKTESDGNVCQIKTMFLIEAVEGVSSCEVFDLNASVAETTDNSQPADEQQGGERTLVTPASPSGSVSSEKQHCPDTESPLTVTCTETSAQCSAAETSLERLDVAITETINTLPLGLQSNVLVETGESAEIEIEPCSADHILLYEHSYSKQDMDNDHLWNKIASLHNKITQLEKKEEKTVAKINVLEGVMMHLKKENIVCEEKRRALENYFTSLEFAMVE
ncbi:THAP domain-containing protein 5 [Amia ocellicauda]|uniref:THAP domain-containing protein 5 n=1 Tax=Amia ocellicauda TaxID=2972642 RepID=UPI003463B6E4